MPSVDEVDLVRRIIALRKHKRIGIVIVEENKWYISSSEYNPHGFKERYSIERVLAHVEAIELLYGVPKKPVAIETQNWGLPFVKEK